MPPAPAPVRYAWAVPRRTPRQHASAATRLILSAALGATLVPAGSLLAQQSTMPAIVDSPTAQTLFEDLRMQAPENPVAAAKLARRLLDEYGTRVVRVGREIDELYASVADETERFLLAHDDVLARFRELESRAAERMLEERGARETASRRRLTTAGLRASLRLAEDALRSDRAAESLAELARVDGHPDLSGAPALALRTLEAAALRRLGRDAAAGAARDRVAGIEGVPPESVAAALAAIDHTARGPAPTAGRSPLSVGAIGGEPNEAWREVWALDLDQSLFRRVHGNAMGVRRQQEVDRARADASLMTTIPTVLDGRIFVSEGHRVRAVDVDSRDEIWSREVGSTGVERESGSVGDLSAIAADRDALIVLEGHALLNMRTAASRVWCLDPASGAARWSKEIDACEGRDELSGLFPVGSPLLVADTVVIAARKPTQRLEQVDWLLGLDRRDGSLRWANSIAGSSGSRLSLGRRHAGLATDGAVLVDSTPLGVVACVRPSDGAVVWLRRFPVPLREIRSAAEPWESYTPAIAGDRIVGLTPDEQEIVALDRLTGRTVEARPVGPDTAWASPNYLLSAPAGDGRSIVLGVGSDVVAFDAGDLSKRLWSLSESTRSLEPARVGFGNRSGIRGRVSIAGSSVVVPGVADILLVDLATGTVRGRVPMAHPTNPLLLEDRIVAAGDESLQVIMPPAQAEAMLRKRLAATPDDPSAAIALMELAAATERPAVALDAARMAERALGRTAGFDELRAELLDKLDAFVARHPEQGSAVFEIAGSVATTPILRVRVELARGEHLRSNGRARDAADCWRRLAGDPLLGSQLAGPGLVRRQVRLDAIARIAKLVSRDRELAAATEAEAAVSRSRIGEKPSVEELASLAVAHPRTLSLAEAIAGAVHLGDAAWLPIAQAALGEALLPPARIEAVELIEAEAVRRRGASTAEQGGGSLQNRVAQLALASGIDRGATLRDPASLPSLGPNPVRGIDLRPRLVEESPGSRLHRDHGLVLGLLEGALVRLAGPDLKMQWRLRLDDREPQLQWANGRIVLWQRPLKGDPSALVIDPAEGALIYATPRAAELWPNNGDGAPLAAGGDRPSRIPTLPTTVTPLCDRESLIIVRRNGDIARIGFMEERPTAVTRRGVLEQVFAENLLDGTLVVAGRRSSGDGSSPVVVLLDSKTLATRLEFEPVSSTDLKWIVTTPLGEVILGTRTAIERWAPTPTGALAPAMVALTPESADSILPVLLGSSILTLDVEGKPTLTPVFEGEQRPLLLGRPDDAQVVRSIEPLPGGLLIQSEDRLHLFSQAGERIGTDSCSREAQVALAVPTRGDLLKVFGLQSIPEEGRVRTQLSCVVERLAPSLGLRIRGQPFEVPGGEASVSRALAIDGWLLLSHSQGTMAVAMPLEQDQGKSDAGTP